MSKDPTTGMSKGFGFVHFASKDRHVVLVDDIFDTGNTLSLLDGLVRERGAASVTICVLLAKPSRYEVDLRPDLIGFEIPDAFVVGYGLDYDGLYRNLPYIGILKPEAVK